MGAANPRAPDCAFWTGVSLCVSNEQPQPWGKSRGYIHFDSPMTSDEAEALVTDPIVIARRSFWPLISFRLKERRWKKKEQSWKIKSRPIAYASHADAHIFAYYAWKLRAPYELLLRENDLSDVVLAYRRHLRSGCCNERGKASFHFAAEAFASIAALGDADVVAMDIKAFFDSLPHDRLKENWEQLLGKSELPPDHRAVFRAVTQFACVPAAQVRAALGVGRRRFAKLRSVRMSSEEFDSTIRHRGVIDVNRKDHGIPQGLPISGLLANLVMFQVDQEMSSAASAVGGSYRRYSDDVLIVAPSGQLGALESRFKECLIPLRLTVQDSKSAYATFVRDALSRPRAKCPLQYLGLEFDGERVLVRQQTIVRFGKRMRRAVARAYRAARRAMKQGGKARIRRRDLYARYSHLKPHPETPLKRRPRGSFMRYAAHAADVVNDCGRSNDFHEQIRRQLRGQWSLLQRLIANADARLAREASTGGSS